MKYNQSMASILAEMNKVKKEQEGETQDPIDQAKKKIDKIKKVAILKKQMADIQKSEDTDIEEATYEFFFSAGTGKDDKAKISAKNLNDAEAKLKIKHKGVEINYVKKNGKEMSVKDIMNEDNNLEEKVEYIEYKFRNSKQAVEVVRFVQAMNTGVPRNLDINDDQENKGIIVFDAGREDFTKIHKMIVKKFRPQILAVENLDKEDEPTIKKVVKGLKKASGLHKAQAKELEKDISDETDLEEFTDKQIERLRKEYQDLKGKESGINPEKFKKLRGMMKRFPKANLLKLVKADIPVLTTGAKAALVMYHGMKWKQLPEDFLPYIELFADDNQELSEVKKGKFKEVDPKVIDRIEKLMRGSRAEKDSIANMLNYFMPPEVVDMVRYKLKIVPKRGKIKF